MSTPPRNYSTAVKMAAHLNRDELLAAINAAGLRATYKRKGRSHLDHHHVELREATVTGADEANPGWLWVTWFYRSKGKVRHGLAMFDEQSRDNRYLDDFVFMLADGRIVALQPKVTS
jgi:hypothetical protein